MPFSRRQMLAGSVSLGAVGLAACTSDEAWTDRPSTDAPIEDGPARHGAAGASASGSGRPVEVHHLLPASTLLALGDGQVLRLGSAPDTVEMVDHGAVLWSAGGTGAEPGRFQRVGGAASGPDGSFWVADTGNRRVQVLSPAGALVDVVGDTGDTPGPLSRPIALAVTPDGRAYVADVGRSGVVPFDADGTAGELIGGVGSEHPFAGIVALEVVGEELAVVEALAPQVQIRAPDGSWVRDIDLPRHFATADLAVDGDQLVLVSHDGRLIRTALDGSTDADDVEVLGHLGTSARGLHVTPDGLIVAAHPSSIGPVQ